MLSICVPTYRGAERLKRLLASMSRAIPCDYDLSVMDDGSPEAEADRASSALHRHAMGDVRPERFRFLRSVENCGWSATVRALVASSSGSSVLLLDDDTLVPEGLLQVATQLLAIENVGALSWRSFGDRPGQSKAARPGFLQPATQLAGYCMAFNRGLWNALGGVDPRFCTYCGDSDFALRATLAGHASYRVWWPLVPHEEHGAFRDAPELDRNAMAVRDLAVFRDKWGCDGVEMEKRALAGLTGESK